MAATFDVIILTAAPAGQAVESGGAFVRIDGREALLMSIELFMSRDEIKQIQLVVNNDEYENAKDRHGLHLGFTGVKLTKGGPTWIEQLQAASQKLSGESTHVIVHDAARPAVPYSDINALQDAAEQHEAATLQSPVRTPMIELDENNRPVGYLRGDRVVHLLTPQAYSRAKFMAFTQSGSEVPAGEMHLVKGSPLNVRVGGDGDAGRIKAMLSLLPKKKVDRMGAFEEAQW